VPRTEPSVAAGSAQPAASVAAISTDWRQVVPVLTNRRVTEREVVLDDGPSLLATLASEEVTRFISPLPSTVEEFERFVAWTHRQRAAGQYVCFAVVPAGMSNPVGLFQVRSLESGFATAEWGFALAPPFWGTGLFVEAARLVLDFAFGTIRVRRLEARASVHNVRGNGALRKLGATPEGVLRRSFICRGQRHDQVLWSILDSDWRNAKIAVGDGGLPTGNAASE
jgi:RimJ/RimL family protein N-acetyltransferase